MADMGKRGKAISDVDSIIMSFPTGVKKSSFTQGPGLRIMGSPF